jgi:hypothetical protein
VYFLFFPPFDLLTMRHDRSYARFGLFEEFREFPFKDFKAAQLVKVLAPLVAADHGDTGRPMDEPNSALGLVLVLSAFAPGHEGLHITGGEKVKK